MITLDVQQGTQEWQDARAGIPTASNFSKILTSTGKPSTQREKYLYTLAAERIIGKSMESYKNASMERGQELEAEARALFEIVKDVTVETVGICFKDDSMTIGGSPDGLVGEDEGLEIKCPESHTHVGYLLAGVLPTEYFQQVQGNLFVTGRKRWWFMSYYPGLKPLIVPVERDEKFIDILDAELIKFNAELAQITERIR